MVRKLIVFDVDGTLLSSQNSILSNTILAIQNLKSKGHIVALATGRSRFLIQDILNDLSISTYIICNGAAAFHDEQQICDFPLNNEKLLELSLFLDEKSVDLALTGLDGISRTTTNDVERIASVMSSLGGDLPKFDPTYIEQNNIYQGLGFYTDNLDGTFETKFPSFRFVRWNNECVDVIAKDSSKATTLLKLAQKMDIAQGDVIAFGDGNNDIEMLSLAGVGVAMGNANDNVKSVANIVTTSNNHDGIYNGLKQLNLI
ncbi:Cof-type HAD-IIB family hydrolase [Listeria monocytogenes]|uniref:Cof-type HAD-IIB family hydrolase n=1 Tax=Listeria monocytogenes TaxID=1639 RepID=UPI0010AF87C6|nr:Cof-type HAD-IIB family hydrolase [Listeria monocytogenes]EAC5805735.1 Cof-type HAD-IIB family hydrolase [Listeria monocytogenes]EAC9482208.1 Cof-type HAD-IIB family hydrolase [Listeria monocytogenes]EHL5826517.1 Cof-type HAD-IIB family hydrolase [Listeria monocytogenes]EKC6210734.1 Cof-type HAD-IIB family hydrolase [Listeria monocytogenes]MDA5918478.1 Cof-type HAD-IIB family hydrolase [Listeria monocytogenes]